MNPPRATIATIALMLGLSALQPFSHSAFCITLAEYAKSNPPPKIHLALDVKDPGATPLHERDQLNNLKKGEPILSLSNLDLTDITGISTFKVEFNGKIVPITEVPRLHLYFNRNKLTEIPAELGRLKNVLYIYFNRNNLTEIPRCMIELAGLEGMYFTENKIAGLPAYLFTFRQLRKLEVARNQITVLPPEIGNLRNLIHFQLAGNKLTSLPDTMAKLVHLRVCDFSDNDLRSIPQSWADDCRVLYQLRFNGNKNLKEFPVGRGFETMTANLEIKDTGIDISKLPPAIRKRIDTPRASGDAKPKAVRYPEE